MNGSFHCFYRVGGGIATGRSGACVKATRTGGEMSRYLPAFPSSPFSCSAASCPANAGGSRAPFAVTA